MKFVFIAVNYNGSFHTKNYLDSLRDMILPQGDVLEAIIVDNQSSDADLSALKAIIAEHSFARLIALETNLGYFKGLNAGIDASSKSDDTLMIVGNNDLLFDSEFVVKLKEISYDDDVLVIAPNITTLAGRRQNPHVAVKVSAIDKMKARIYFSNYHVGQAFRYANRWLRGLRPAQAASSVALPEPGQMKIKRGIGACYVLTPRFFHFHQRLDDRVFLWGEEALLSNQVESVNGCTLYDPTIKILHCESASVKFIESRKKYDIVKASYKIYRDYL